MIDQNMKQKELKYVKLMEDLKEKILSGEKDWVIPPRF